MIYLSDTEVLSHANSLTSLVNDLMDNKRPVAINIIDTTLWK